jgi:hypothetical protein
MSSPSQPLTPAIQFALSKSDAEVLGGLLREQGFAPQESAIETSEARLGFGMADLVLLSVPLVQMAELAAKTVHIHALAHIISHFISSRERKLIIRYERGGGFEIETNCTPGEIEPLISRLARVWVLPAPRRES